MLIDLTLAILLVIAIVKGYQKGFIIAVFSVIAFIIGLAAALKFSALVAAWLQNSVSISAKWLPFVAFATVFIGVVLLVRIGAKLLEKSFQAIMLGWLNRIGGIILYAALYLIIASIFIFYVQKLQLLQPGAVESSQALHLIEPWGPIVIDNFGRVIPVFKDMFTELGDFFNALSNKMQH